MSQAHSVFLLCQETASVLLVTNSASSSSLLTTCQAARQRRGANTAWQLPLALLIRKTVISQQVPPGRFPCLAPRPELSHMANPRCEEAEEVRCFSWVQNQSSDKEQEGFGAGC